MESALDVALINNKLNKLNQQYSKETLPIFLSYCLELSNIISNYNFNIEAYNSNGINKFLSLETNRQFEILTIMRSYVVQIGEATHAKVDFRNHKKHAWFFMRNINLFMPDDVFDQIDENDMIEIYDASSIQIFRSLELYKYMSYSFSEIFSYSWMELFTRDDFVFKRISETVSQILSGKINNVFKPNFPIHYAEEIFSKKRIWIKMQSDLMCKLYRKDGSVGGFLHTFKIPEHGYLNKTQL